MESTTTRQRATIRQLRQIATLRHNMEKQTKIFSFFIKLKKRNSSRLQLQKPKAIQHYSKSKEKHKPRTTKQDFPFPSLFSTSPRGRLCNPSRLPTPQSYDRVVDQAFSGPLLTPTKPASSPANWRCPA
ncbi:hypothetical protein P8452_32251 [Trifolium repens]|nr:hypothetical protein P8452_32251 [Trifolium repens]